MGWWRQRLTTFNKCLDKHLNHKGIEGNEWAKCHKTGLSIHGYLMVSTDSGIYLVEEHSCIRNSSRKVYLSDSWNVKSWF